MAKGNRFVPDQAFQYIMARLQQLGVPGNVIEDKARLFVRVMYEEGGYIGVTQGSLLDQQLAQAAAQAAANQPRGLPHYQNPVPGAPVAPSHEPAPRTAAPAPTVAAHQPNRGVTALNPHQVPVQAPVMTPGSDQPEGMTDVPPAPQVEY